MCLYNYVVDVYCELVLILNKPKITSRQVSFNPGWETSFSPGFPTGIVDPGLKVLAFSPRSCNRD